MQDAVGAEDSTWVLKALICIHERQTHPRLLSAKIPPFVQEIVEPYIDKDQKNREKYLCMFDLFSCPSDGS